MADEVNDVSNTKSDDRGSGSASKRKQAEWFDIDEEHNTYVYVSGLPTTMTEPEFILLMQKYGIIAKKTSPGNPYNVKLYKEKDGSFKGDALCRYVCKESVSLALDLLDGYQYDEKHLIHCELAKFQLKGSYDPSKKPRIDPRSKEKHKKAVQKLLSWEPKAPKESRQARVILKNMFTPEEIKNEPELLVDIRDDVENECSKISEPKKVEIFENHPEGVISVTFSELHEAEACIRALNNRPYAGRFVSAELWDGKTKYKIREKEEESTSRLEKWKSDIQTSEIDEGSDAHPSRTKGLT